MNKRDKLSKDEIFNSDFVQNVFDKMSASYSYVNYITSFGFSERWRKECIEELNIKEGAVVADLMTGMGECWKFILKKDKKIQSLIALDFSQEMIRRAHQRKKRYTTDNITILQEDIFNNSISDNSVDYISSGFGLKTFNKVQLSQFAKQVDRILKPNGSFSFIEVSVPKFLPLRILYMFYLKYIIPILGSLLLGNPESYKMLGVYTELYGNSREVKEIFENQGFEVEYINYFFGCASGIKGVKRS